MNIGIDISQIIYEGTGVSRFTKGLVNSILDFDKSNKWIFFFSSLRQSLDQEIEKKIYKKGHKLIRWKIPSTLLSFFWNDLHKLKILNIKLLNSLDWFITSDWTEPHLNCKKATVVHDLVYLRHPETVDKMILTTQKKRLNWVKKESNLIFADSEATKNDLIDLVQIDSKKIIINYPGVYMLLPNKQQVNRTLLKFNLKKPFILTVGKLEPRKNLERLINAYDQIKKPKPDLVIVGQSGWGDINNETMKQFNNDIRFLGFVNDNDLYSLYVPCLFFIYPSIWEGFGYPVVEAMKLGAPIATSNTSSLKEIADGAVLLFDPFKINEITHCINTLAQDEKIRKELSAKGFKRSKMFTWRNYYEKLIKTIYDYRY